MSTITKKQLIRMRPKAVARDPLLAVPIQSEGVQSHIGREGRLHLRRVLPPRGRFDRIMRRVFGTRAIVVINVDARGAYFWEQIDGRRNLHAIAQLIGIRFNLTPEAARQSTVLFTKMMMIRSLIQLRLDDPATTRQDKASHE